MLNKLIGIVVLSLITVGCAHSRVVGYDLQQNTVEIQAGAYDSRDDVEKVAVQYCNGPVNLVGMTERVVGYRTTASTRRYGDSAYGSAHSRSVIRNVFTYTCWKS